MKLKSLASKDLLVNLGQFHGSQDFSKTSLNQLSVESLLGAGTIPFVGSKDKNVSSIYVSFY